MIFKPNSVCLLTNKRSNTYPTGFSISSRGHAPGVGIGRAAGSNPFVCPSRYLLFNQWKKSNQIWCVSYSHEWGVQRHIFCPAPWGPGEGPKAQMSLNFNYKVNFKEFQTKLCMYFLVNCPQGSWDLGMLGV